jgi:N12 class adenine-specific DNA methylase
MPQFDFGTDKEFTKVDVSKRKTPKINASSTELLKARPEVSRGPGGFVGQSAPVQKVRRPDPMSSEGLANNNVSQAQKNRGNKQTIEYAINEVDRIFGKNSPFRDDYKSWLWARAGGAIAPDARGFDPYIKELLALIGDRTGEGRKAIAAEVALYKERRGIERGGFENPWANTKPTEQLVAEAYPSMLAMPDPKAVAKLNERRAEEEKAKPKTLGMPNPFLTGSPNTIKKMAGEEDGIMGIAGSPDIQRTGVDIPNTYAPTPPSQSEIFALQRQQSEDAKTLRDRQALVRLGLDPNVTKLTGDDARAVRPQAAQNILSKFELLNRQNNPAGTLEDVRDAFATPDPQQFDIMDAAFPLRNFLKNGNDQKLQKSMVRQGVIQGKQYGGKEGDAYSDWNLYVDSLSTLSQPFSGFARIATGLAPEELTPEHRAINQIADFGFEIIVSGAMSGGAAPAARATNIVNALRKIGVSEKFAPALVRASDISASMGNSLPAFLAFDMPGYATMVRDAGGDFGKAASMYGGSIVDGFKPSSYADPNKPIDEKVGHALAAISGTMIGVGIMSKGAGVVSHIETTRQMRDLSAIDIQNLNLAGQFIQDTGVVLPARFEPMIATATAELSAMGVENPQQVATSIALVKHVTSGKKWNKVKEQINQRFAEAAAQVPVQPNTRTGNPNLQRRELKLPGTDPQFVSSEPVAEPQVNPFAIPELSPENMVAQQADPQVVPGPPPVVAPPIVQNQVPDAGNMVDAPPVQTPQAKQEGRQADLPDAPATDSDFADAVAPEPAAKGKPSTFDQLVEDGAKLIRSYAKLAGSDEAQSQFGRLTNSSELKAINEFIAGMSPEDASAVISRLENQFGIGFSNPRDWNSQQKSVSQAIFAARTAFDNAHGEKVGKDAVDKAELPPVVKPSKNEAKIAAQNGGMDLNDPTDGDAQDLRKFAEAYRTQGASGESFTPIKGMDFHLDDARKFYDEGVKARAKVDKEKGRIDPKTLKAPEGWSIRRDGFNEDINDFVMRPNDGTSFHMFRISQVKKSGEYEVTYQHAKTGDKVKLYALPTIEEAVSFASKSAEKSYPVGGLNNPNLRAKGWKYVGTVDEGRAPTIEATSNDPENTTRYKAVPQDPAGITYKVLMNSTGRDADWAEIALTGDASAALRSIKRTIESLNPSEDAEAKSEPKPEAKAEPQQETPKPAENAPATSEGGKKPTTRKPHTYGDGTKKTIVTLNEKVPDVVFKQIKNKSISFKGGWNPKSEWFAFKNPTDAEAFEKFADGVINAYRAKTDAAKIKDAIVDQAGAKGIADNIIVATVGGPPKPTGDGLTASTTLDPAIVKALEEEGFKPLAYDPEKYFDNTEASDKATVMDLPLDQLFTIRARPEGIVGAAEAMMKAKPGKQREPISVIKRSEGGYTVFDGNSTVNIAKASGWKDIRVQVFKNEADAKVHEDLQKIKKEETKKIVTNIILSLLRNEVVTPFDPKKNDPYVVSQLDFAQQGKEGAIARIAWSINAANDKAILDKKTDFMESKLRRKMRDNNLFTETWVKQQLEIPDYQWTQPIDMTLPLEDQAKQLADLAAKDAPIMDAYIRSLIDQGYRSYGGTIPISPDKAPGGVKTIPTIIEKARRPLKIGKKLWYQVATVGDPLRMTVEFNDFDSLEKITQTLPKDWKIYDLEDTMAQANSHGYRMVSLQAQMPSGLFVEVQFLHPLMLEAKGRQHKNYDIARALEGTVMTPEQRDAHHRAVVAMQDDYGNAYKGILEKSGVSEKDAIASIHKSLASLRGKALIFSRSELPKNPTIQSPSTRTTAPTSSADNATIVESRSPQPKTDVGSTRGVSDSVIDVSDNSIADSAKLPIKAGDPKSDPKTRVITAAKNDPVIQEAMHKTALDRLKTIKARLPYLIEQIRTGNAEGGFRMSDNEEYLSMKDGDGLNKLVGDVDEVLTTIEKKKYQVDVSDGSNPTPIIAAKVLEDGLVANTYRMNDEFTTREEIKRRVNKVLGGLMTDGANGNRDALSAARIYATNGDIADLVTTIFNQVKRSASEPKQTPASSGGVLINPVKRPDPVAAPAPTAKPGRRAKPEGFGANVDAKTRAEYEEALAIANGKVSDKPLGMPATARAEYDSLRDWDEFDMDALLAIMKFNAKGFGDAAALKDPENVASIVEWSVTEFGSKIELPEIDDVRAALSKALFSAGMDRGDARVFASRYEFDFELDAPEFGNSEQKVDNVSNEQQNNEQDGSGSVRPTSVPGDEGQRTQDGRQDGGTGDTEAGTGTSPNSDRGGNNEAPTGERDGEPSEGSRGDSDSRTYPESVSVGDVDAEGFHTANYTLTPQDIDSISKSGDVHKRKALVAAIKAYRAAVSQGGKATPAQKRDMSRFPGWGWTGNKLNHKFRGKTDKNAELYNAVYEILTKEEFNTARNATINSHYTSPAIVSKIWDALEHIGFKPDSEGNLSALEPSAGSGLFASLDRFGSQWDMVELEKMAGTMLGAIHSKANVQITPFQKASLKPGGYDLVITNVPFDSGRIDSDLQFIRETNNPSLLRSLHDYFIAKSVHNLKPNGVAALISTHFSMDNVGEDAVAYRRWLSENAELIGAIRLPNSAFKANAGTEVVTDIMFFRKREPGEIPSPDEAKFVVSKRMDIEGESYAVNEYFHDNPQMVIGNHSAEGSMRSAKEYTVKPIGSDLEAQIQSAIESLPKDKMIGMKRGNNASDTTASGDLIVAPPHARANAFFEHNGTVYLNENGSAVKVDASSEKSAELSAFIKLRDSLLSTVRGMRSGVDDEGLRILQGELKKNYDAYVGKFGAIKSKTRPWAGDPNAGTVFGLEYYDVSQKKVSKLSKVFTERVVNMDPVVDKASNAKDALLGAISNKGVVDIAEMQRLYPKTQDEILKELKGIVFKDPQNPGKFVTVDDLTSGNVVAKLAAAREAEDEAAIKVLEKNQPVPVKPANVIARPGAHWIPAEVYLDYLSKKMAVGKYAKGGRESELIEIVHDKIGGTFSVTKKQVQAWKYPNADTQKFFNDAGANHISLTRLFRHFLNNTEPIVNNSDGSINIDATVGAREGLEFLKEDFENYSKTKNAAVNLAEIYNREVNVWMPRTWDGSWLKFPGINPIALERSFRSNAVLRALVQDSVMFAHEVGTGKTWTMVAAVMKARETGMVKKPILLAKNGTEYQIMQEALEIYPDMRILTGDASEMSKKERAEFVGRAALDDWDLIIVSHSTAELIPLSPERQNAYMESEIKRLEDEIEEMEVSGQDANTVKKNVKRMETMIKNIRATIKRSNARNINTGYWDDIGADMLLVDEWHAFRKLPVISRRQGMASQGSQRAFNVLMKVHMMREEGAKFVFATGTPVTNTMAELYTVQRFLQPKVLSELGLNSFDQWLNTYGETRKDLERGPTGNMKIKERVRNFVNVPQLQQMIFSQMDVVFADDVTNPDGSPMILRPKRVDRDGITVTGQPVVVKLYPDLAQRKFFRQLDEDYTAWKNKPYEEQKDDPNNPLRVSVMGRMASQEMMLVDPAEPLNPNGKIMAMVGNIKEVYDRTNPEKGAQIVFSDFGTPKDSDIDESVYEGMSEEEASAAREENESKPGFTKSLYSVFIDQLVKAGIPRNEIEYIQRWKAEDKPSLYRKINNGEVRVIIGSKQLSEGVNAQERLAAIHHMNPPWFPGENTQRNGRPFRQKNKYAEPERWSMSQKGVIEFQYVMLDSYDTSMWSAIGRKEGFIKQILTPTTELELEDISTDAAMSGDMIAAIATGDSRMGDYAIAKIDRDDLRRKSRSQQRVVDNTRIELEVAQEALAEWTAIAAQNKIALRQVPDTYPGQSELRTTGGEKFGEEKSTGGMWPEQAHMLSLLRSIPTDRSYIAYKNAQGSSIYITRHSHSGSVTLELKQDYTTIFRKTVQLPARPDDPKLMEMARQNFAADLAFQARYMVKYSRDELVKAEKNIKSLTSEIEDLKTQPTTNKYRELLEKAEAQVRELEIELGLSDLNDSGEIPAVWGAAYETPAETEEYAAKANAPSDEVLGMPAQQTPNSRATARINKDIAPLPLDPGETAAGIHSQDIMVAIPKSVAGIWRKGKTIRGLIGQFDPKNKVTTIRYRNDIFTFAHELGHRLDDDFGLIPGMAPIKTKAGNDHKFLREFDLELIPMGEPYSPQSSDSLRKRQEGVARFVQLYMTNPEMARQLAPKFYTYFESKVPKTALIPIKEAGIKIRKLVGLSSVEAGREHIVVAPRATKSQAKNIVKQVFEKDDTKPFAHYDWIGNQRFNLVDDLAPLEAAEREALRRLGMKDIFPSQSPTLMARQLKYHYNRMSEIANKGMINAYGEHVTPPPMEILQHLDTTSLETLTRDMKDMFLLGISRRTLEEAERVYRVAEIKANEAATVEEAESILDQAEYDVQNMTGLGQAELRGSDISEAKAIIAEIEADPERHDQLMEGLRKLRSIHRAALEYQYQKGRLSREQVDALYDSHQEYISFSRIMEEGSAGFGPSQSNLKSVRKTLYKRKGSDRKFRSPFIAMLENVDKAVLDADRNEVLLNFVNLVRAGDSTMYEEGAMPDLAFKVDLDAKGDNLITVFNDGKEERWQVDPVVYKSLNIVSTPEIESLHNVAKLVRFVKSTITTFPAFAFFKNPARDTIARVINSRVGSKLTDLKINPSDAEKAAYAMFGGGMIDLEYMRSRGAYEDAQSAMMLDAVKNKPKGWILGSPARLWQSYMKAVQVPEMANRLATLNAAYQVGIDRYGDAYEAKLFAGQEARDDIDFARAGVKLREVNKYIMFINSAVQGLDRAQRGIRNDPAGYAKRALLYTVLAELVMQMANAAQGDDVEEKYDQMPNFQKDFFYLFHIPGTDGFLRIPKPFELGLPASYVGRLVRWSRLKAKGDEYAASKAFDGFAKDSVLKTLMVVDESILVGGPIAPLAEAFITNMDSFRGKEVISPYEKDLALELRKGDDNMSTLGKVLQEASMNVGRGIDARQWDHMVKGFGGGYGQVATTPGRKDMNVATWASIFTGMWALPPSYGARDVQEVIRISKSIGIKNPLSDLTKAVFDETLTKEEKSAAARELLTTATQMRKDLDQARSEGKTKEDQINLMRMVMGSKPKTFDEEED